jgi:DNA-binding NarL/FixJ family response regulator
VSENGAIPTALGTAHANGDGCSVEARPVRVLLAIEVAVYREGLAEALKRVDGMEVVGTAATGGELLRHAARRGPHVVLLDLAIEEGLEIVSELGRLLPGVGLDPLPEAAPTPVEDGDSYAANALIKARSAVRATGRAAIAVRRAL